MSIGSMMNHSLNGGSTEGASWVSGMKTGDVFFDSQIEHVAKTIQQQLKNICHLHAKRIEELNVEPGESVDLSNIKPVIDGLGASLVEPVESGTTMSPPAMYKELI